MSAYILGETIAVRSGARMLSEALKQEENKTAIKLFSSIEGSIKTISDRIESTVFGMYPREVTEIHTKVYSENQRLKIRIIEIDQSDDVITQRKIALDKVISAADRLIKLSNAIAKRAVNTDMENGQLYYVSTQAERIHRIKSLILNIDGTKGAQGSLTKELKNFTNVLKQLEMGNKKNLKGKITNINTRKIIHATSKKLIGFKNGIGILTGTNNQYNEIKGVFIDAATRAENLSRLTNKLGILVSNSNNSRLLKPATVVFGIIFTMLLLIGTAVSWWLYAKETAVIDSQRLKAQKVAYKDLLLDLKNIGKGDLTGSINTGNPYTKDIAGPLNEMIKSFGGLITDVVVQSEAANKGAHLAEEVRVDLITLSEKIEGEFNSHTNNLNDFEARYLAFDKSYSKLPDKMNGQLIKLNELMTGVSKNYELATKLTQEAREISNQFKNQSEVSQTLQGDAGKIKAGLTEIESAVFHMQISSSSEETSELSNLLELVQTASMQTTELTSNTDVIVTSSGQNQIIIEEMRELILSLNSVAEEASSKGNELKEESVEINSLLNGFKKSSDDVLDVVNTIITSTKDTKVAVTDQGIKLNVMLEAVQSVAHAVLEVKSNTEKFKISKGDV